MNFQNAEHKLKHVRRCKMTRNIIFSKQNIYLNEDQRNLSSLQYQFLTAENS